MDDEVLKNIFAQKVKVEHGKASIDLTHYKDVPIDVCPYCRDKIHPEDEIVEAINYKFHKHHLCCSYCQQLIQPNEYKEKDDMIFHPNCYSEVLEERCAKCGGFVKSDTVIHAISRAYHPECFVCAHCGDPQVKDRYMNLYGFPYCTKCFQQFKNILPECYACKQPLLPNDKRESIVCEGTKYFFHPTCIQCSQCAITPANRRLTIFNKSVYCVKCLEVVRKKICSDCNKPIEGECCQVENCKFHPDSYKCHDCGTSLQNGVAVLDHGILRCRKCTEAYIKQCRGCHKSDEEPQIVACGGKWHKACFNCMKCQKNLAESKYVNMNGVPCCKDCYHAMVNNNEIDNWRRPIEK